MFSVAMKGSLHTPTCTASCPASADVFSDNEIFINTAATNSNLAKYICSLTFFLENHAGYERMWKNVVEPGRPQMTIQ
jgi:hypothetical protein